MAPCWKPVVVLPRAAVWAGLLGAALLPLPGWAAPGPTAVQPLVQPQPQAQRFRVPSARLSPASVQASQPAPPSANPALPSRPGAAPARGSVGPRSEAFGRWQPRLLSCERNLTGAGSGDCAAVVVDQRSAGVMRVSWQGRGGPGLSSTLTFVGTLAGGSEPMACRQAICGFSKPFELTVSSVSQSLFDVRGVASALPSAWPVNGSCHLDAGRIACAAKALSGEAWTAVASLN